MRAKTEWFIKKQVWTKLGPTQCPELLYEQEYGPYASKHSAKKAMILTTSDPDTVTIFSRSQRKTFYVEEWESFMRHWTMGPYGAKEAERRFVETYACEAWIVDGEGTIIRHKGR